MYVCIRYIYIYIHIFNTNVRTLDLYLGVFGKQLGKQLEDLKGLGRIQSALSKP